MVKHISEICFVCLITCLHISHFIAVTYIAPDSLIKHPTDNFMHRYWIIMAMSVSINQVLYHKCRKHISRYIDTSYKSFCNKFSHIYEEELFTRHIIWAIAPCGFLNAFKNLMQFQENEHNFHCVCNICPCRISVMHNSNLFHCTQFFS